MTVTEIMYVIVSISFKDITKSFICLFEYLTMLCLHSRLAVDTYNRMQKRQRVKENTESGNGKGAYVKKKCVCVIMCACMHVCVCVYYC